MNFEALDASRLIDRLLVAGVAAVALSGCSAEQTNTNRISWELRAGGSIYDSRVDAKTQDNEPCTTLETASTVTPTTTEEIDGGRIIIKMAKSDPNLHLADPAKCAGDWLFANVK